MTQLQFISGMKKLSNYYFRDITNDQIVDWYDMFKEVEFDIFEQAIKEISHESKYMPNASILFEKCSSLNKNNLCDLVRYMYDQGYFHQGVERLSDEQASRNLDKTLMWLEKGIIPGFLKADMEEYLTKYKQSKLINEERLQIKC